MADEGPPGQSRRSLLAGAGAATLGIPAFAATVAAQPYPPSSTGRPILSFRDEKDLASARIDDDIGRIWLSGRTVAGIGGGWWERAGQAQSRLPHLRAGDGSLWRLSPGDRLDVRQFGATGDGKADDTAAIQAALDCAVYGEGLPRTVYFPAGVYRTTDTLQVGYGFDYRTATLLGETFPHPNGREVVNSLIEADFWDRPCINLQGGRRAHFRAISLRGRNHAHLRAVYETMPDRTVRAHWLDPGAPPSADSRTAPYAGICIDAYSGERPDHAYPEARDPAFVPERDQYGRNFSSHTFIEDCQITGFCVGLMIQPGRVPVASNGDFVNIRDCDISYNLTGIGIGNADARCNNIANSRLHFNYTSLDSVNYGNGRGSFMGHVAGSSFDNNVRIVDIDVAGHLPQGGGSPSFVDCYGESIHSLGRFMGKENSAPKTIRFEQCKFQFSVKHGEFSPSSLLEGKGGIAVLHDCTFMGGFCFFAFDCIIDMRNFAMVQPMAGGALGLDTAAGRAANGYTCGILARDATQVSLFPAQVSGFSGIHGRGMGPHLSHDRFPISIDTPDGLQPAILPWWARMLFDGESYAFAPPALELAIDRAALPMTGQAVKGSEIRIEFETSGSSGLALIGPGDLARDEDTGHVFFIRTVDRPASRTAITLQALTGLRTLDRGKTFETSARLSPDGGNLTFQIARRFYPATRLARAFAEKGEARLVLRDTVFSSEPVEPGFIRQGDILPGRSAGMGHPPVVLGRVSAAAGRDGEIDLAYALTVAIDGSCPSFIRPLEEG